MKSIGFRRVGAAKDYGGYGGVLEPSHRLAAPREETMKLSRLLTSAVALAASVRRR